MGRAEATGRAAEPAAGDGRSVAGPPPVSLAAKVAFLARPDAYGDATTVVDRRETHMSWLFLTHDEVYKLKKPVRFSYLDFSTLERRRTACEAELALNRRLASDVYERVVPLSRRGTTLTIGAGGEVVDWLVVMRRLDESRTLEQLLRTRQIAPRQLDPLVAALRRFYCEARRICISPAAHLARWRTGLAINRQVLLQSRLGLPTALVCRIDGWQRAFLARYGDLLIERARRRLIVDGHGDLRPEHIWPEPPVRVIDCLEFNAELRAIDPLDELAFLHVECSRLGAARHGAHIVRRLAAALRGSFSPELFAFYCSYRATVRARLAIAHLLEATPRTPGKWRPLALSYLRAADRARHCRMPGEGRRHARS